VFATAFSEKQWSMKRGAFSLVRITEELLGRNSTGSDLENRD
jgi:hypothetical protein